MIVPGFVGPAFTGRSSYWDGQDLVNLFVDQDTAGGKSPSALVGTPGMTAWATLAPGEPVRGMLAAGDGNLYAVCGSIFFQVTPQGQATIMGTLQTGTGAVSLAENMGVQIILADGANGYLYTFATEAFSQIVNADFPGASLADYLDAYFVVAKPGSNQFYLSALNDGSTWDGVSWATKEGKPDQIVSMAVNHRQLWLFGQVSTEIWYNTGAAYPTFPLSPISGVFLETGCAARMSSVVMDNTVVWLTDKLQVVRATGFAPQIISTRPMEYLISQYPRVDDAQAFAYVQGGHTFYVLTFPTADATWVYDAATSFWHRRKSFGQGRWQANCYARFGGMHLVGGAASGKIYELSETAYSEDGAIIERIRISPPMSQENKRLFMSEFQIDFEPGVGLAAGEGGGPGPGQVQGGDPQAMLQWSDDGGRTWSSEHWVSMGAVGAYSNRARWRRLGSFRNRQFKLKVTDPVKVVITSAYAQGSLGNG